MVGRRGNVNVGCAFVHAHWTPIDAMMISPLLNGLERILHIIHHRQRRRLRTRWCVKSMQLRSTDCRTMARTYLEAELPMTIKVEVISPDKYNLVWTTTIKNNLSQRLYSTKTLSRNVINLD